MLLIIKAFGALELPALMEVMPGGVQICTAHALLRRSEDAVNKEARTLRTSRSLLAMQV